MSGRRGADSGMAAMEERGGPSAEDMEKARETSDMLGEHGHVLLHGGGRPGQCADLFNRTAHAIAVLAFVPGGVELFGTRFEAKAGQDDDAPGRGRKRRQEAGKDRVR